MCEGYIVSLHPVVQHYKVSPSFVHLPSGLCCSLSGKLVVDYGAVADMSVLWWLQSRLHLPVKVPGTAVVPLLKKLLDYLS